MVLSKSKSTINNVYLVDVVETDRAICGFFRTLYSMNIDIQTFDDMTAGGLVTGSLAHRFFVKYKIK